MHVSRLLRHRRAWLAAPALAGAVAVAIAATPTLANDPSEGPLPETDKAVAAASMMPQPQVPATPALEHSAPGDPAATHVKNVPGRTGGHVSVEGDRMYVGAYGFGFQIFDITDPANPTLAGEWRPGPQAANDPGARADAVPDAAVFDGRHIVAFGGTRRTAATTQTEFVDVTDPANPRLLWRFTGAADGEAHNSDIVDERRLWLPSGGSGVNGLRIYDLNPLLGAEPAVPTNLARFDPVALWEASPYRGDRPVGREFSHIHDVEVYTDHRVLLPEDQWETVAAPPRNGRSSDRGKPAANGHAVKVPTYAQRDIALLAEGGRYLENGRSGSIFVVDITNPREPVVLNRWLQSETDGKPIRYFHEVQLLESDPTVMIVTDEDLHNGCDAGGVHVLRISEDLTQAEKISEWFIGTGTPAPVCSVHVFSTHGDHMFIGSYNAGLQIVDLSDPANPRKVPAPLLPGANSWGAKYHNGYVYVGDFGARGLDVFRIDWPS